ncbi:hypothetical protein B7P43_G11070 [Cryptotermes secundus]|uniref:Uncharacterized protein n=1 Tax=Cryptotermes secundus TaxID=105785 RepID=A0A2J7RF51_9NEOP|nr:hypothetical protein B7P43_G11070 [Cryptotermes secundus]
MSSHQMLPSKVKKCHHYGPHSALTMNQSANPVVHKPSLVTKIKFVEYLSKKTISMVLVHKRTIQTEWPLLVGEVSANFRR